MILCGWCGSATRDEDRCTACLHVDPRRPWEQRATPVPEVQETQGRPALDRMAIRKRVHDAIGTLRSQGIPVTNAALADLLEVSEKTVRRWRQMTA